MRRCEALQSAREAIGIEAGREGVREGGRAMECGEKGRERGRRAKCRAAFWLREADCVYLCVRAGESALERGNRECTMRERERLNNHIHKHTHTPIHTHMHIHTRVTQVGAVTPNANLRKVKVRKSQKTN
jgi:hypothetical protein